MKQELIEANDIKTEFNDRQRSKMCQWLCVVEVTESVKTPIVLKNRLSAILEKLHLKPRKKKNSKSKKNSNLDPGSSQDSTTDPELERLLSLLPDPELKRLFKKMHKK